MAGKIRLFRLCGQKLLIALVLASVSSYEAKGAVNWRGWLGIKQKAAEPAEYKLTQAWGVLKKSFSGVQKKKRQELDTLIANLYKEKNDLVRLSKLMDKYVEFKNSRYEELAKYTTLVIMPLIKDMEFKLGRVRFFKEGHVDRAVDFLTKEKEKVALLLHKNRKDSLSSELQKAIDELMRVYVKKEKPSFI